jgi:MoxR-like ATPase
MSSQPVVQILNASVGALIERLQQRLFLSDDFAKLVLCPLLCRGHLLLEGPPGVGKTTLAKTLAQLVSGQFNRIQMTSDTMPADLVGVLRVHPGTREFEFRPGPLFGNCILADELNRSSSKTQSALLEAMAESTVTVDGVTHKLPQPFFVVATQNPFDSEGVFRLAESQLDRFTMFVEMTYPSPEVEEKIYRFDLQSAAQTPDARAVLSLDQLRAIIDKVDATHVDTSLLSYVQKVLAIARQDSSPAGESTLSVRAGVHWLQAARAMAVLNGRDYVVPKDLLDVAISVLAHRLTGGGHRTLKESRSLVESFLSRVPRPR